MLASQDGKASADAFTPEQRKARAIKARAARTQKARQGLDNKVQNEGSKPDVQKERLGGKSQEEKKFKENDKGENKSETNGKHQRQAVLSAPSSAFRSRRRCWRLRFYATRCFRRSRLAIPSARDTQRGTAGTEFTSTGQQVAV